MHVPGRPPALRAALTGWWAGCALVLLVSLALACGEGRPQGVQPPGGGATAPAGSTPAASASPTLGAELSLMLVQEFGQNADTLRLVDPRDPSRSRTVLTIEHAEGWGARTALSPDGRRVAYVVLPRGARDDRRQAELWVASLEGGSPSRQATEIDLRGGVLWAADGSAVFARRSTADAPQLVRVDQGGTTEPRVIAAASGAASLTLAGAHGRYIYWSEVSQQTGQSVLKSYDLQSGQIATVVTLAGEPARDLALSPDGARLAFTGSSTFKAYLTDLGDRSVVELPTGGQPALRPAWLPDASAVAFGLAPAGGQPGRVVLFQQGAARDLISLQRGFLQPLVWAPDGSSLVCYYYTGTISNPGTPALVTVGRDGRQAPLSLSGEVEVVGWARGRL
ncbi:MAG: hypothetical protein NZ695_02560 [Dehalococcoidia bacterium]|jgi:Tol biopolymer transport system component|nr:hypothetical protein [Dehalococcoidia bacterium]MDW8008176.1 hypothetical protein [Chloroflexota bacterium]